MSRTLAVFFVVLVVAQPGGAWEPGDKPNVLFIAVDDLNHWVGHLGRNPQARTSNIDRLAGMGVTFTRSYCAAPVCNASRAAYRAAGTFYSYLALSLRWKLPCIKLCATADR